MRPFLLVVPGVVALASCAGCSEPETAAPVPAPTAAAVPAVPTKAKGNRGRPPKEAFGSSGSPALGARPSLEVRDDL